VAEPDLWDKFWKDKHGEVVIYQRPNVFLLGWLVLTIVSLFFNGTFADVLGYIASAVLIIWSLLEIFKGTNYFRRLLGGIVLLLTVLSLFRMF
jgi:hypothetical protein